MKNKPRMHFGVIVGVLLFAVWMPAKAGSLPGKTMAADRIVCGTFDSQVLGCSKAYTLVLPEKPDTAKPIPVLIVLHGLGRNERTLIDDSGTKEVLLNAPFACLMPDGDGNWYINSPAADKNRYADYLDEVIAHASAKYNLSVESAHRGICGWSMGGYGAVMTMLRRPDDFAAVATIIGLLDYPSKDLPEGQTFQIPAATFGTDPQVWNTVNPIFKTQALQGHPVLLVAGERAFDWTMNKNFSAELKRLGIDHEWVVLSQGHTFAAVQAGLPLVVNFMRMHIVEQR